MNFKVTTYQEPFHKNHEGHEGRTKGTKDDILSLCVLCEYFVPFVVGNYTLRN
jgi:hypothetical protein